MRRRHRIRGRCAPGVALLVALLAATGTRAQESPSFRQNEGTFSAGGHPHAGVVLTAVSYRITLDAIGSGTLAADAGSTSYRVNGGLVPSYAPPSAVRGLRFTDRTTLAWQADPTVGSYNVYRDGLDALAASGYGVCFETDVAAESAIDTDPLPFAGAFFYLVTAVNRLREEGSKGADSSATERGNPEPCP